MLHYYEESLARGVSGGLGGAGGGAGKVGGGALGATVGDFSRALLANNSNLMDGDIVTLVRIWSPYLVPVSGFAEAVEGQTLVGVRDTDPNPRWSLVQERISVDSTAESSVFCAFDAGSGAVLCLKSPDDVGIGGDECLYACALVVSRPMAKGMVYVSTSVIGCGARTRGAVEVGMGERWKEWVARNYVEVKEGVSQDAVLKGSLLPSGPSAVGPVEDVVGDVDGAVASVDVAFAGSAATTLRFDCDLGGSYVVSRLRLVFTPVVGESFVLPFINVTQNGPLAGSGSEPMFQSQFQVGNYYVFLGSLTQVDGSWCFSSGPIACLGGNNGQAVVGTLDFYFDE